MSFDSAIAKKPADATSPTPAGADGLASARMENPPPRPTEGTPGSHPSEQSAKQYLPEGHITPTSIDFGSPFPADVNSPNPKDHAPCPPEAAVVSTPTDIKTSNVNQGQVGDCFFAASLASLANTPKGQEAINNMVKTNPDGTTTVTFPGDTSHPVTLSQQEIDKALKDNLVHDGSSALTAVQVAFFKYDRVGDYGTGVNSVQGEGIPFLSQVKTPTDALHLLTGERTASEQNGLNSDFNFGSTSPENMAKFMSKALESGQPVVAGTSPFTESPLVSTHEYSVLGFDQSTGMVTVRNPWGFSPDTKNGETKNGITDIGGGKMTMSLATFQKNFSDVAAAGVNPTETRLNDLANDVGSVAGAAGDGLNDLIHGRFSDVLGDEGKLFENGLQTLSDVGTSSWNEALSLVGSRVRGVYDTISKPLHGELPSAQDVMNAVGVPQPVLDAASTVTHAVTSTVSDLWDDIF